jgi:hypothetical protein
LAIPPGAVRGERARGFQVIVANLARAFTSGAAVFGADLRPC